MSTLLYSEQTVRDLLQPCIDTGYLIQLEDFIEEITSDWSLCLSALSASTP